MNLFKASFLLNGREETVEGIVIKEQDPYYLTFLSTTGRFFVINKSVATIEKLRELTQKEEMEIMSLKKASQELFLLRGELEKKEKEFLALKQKELELIMFSHEQLDYLRQLWTPKAPITIDEIRPFLTEEGYRSLYYLVENKLAILDKNGGIHLNLLPFSEELDFDEALDKKGWIDLLNDSMIVALQEREQSKNHDQDTI